MLCKLPLEILDNVFYKLRQDDVLSLSLTNSMYYRLLQPRLHSVIVVDSTPKLFLEDSDSLIEFNQLKNIHVLDNRYIYGINISTIYGLKLFFKHLNSTNVRYIKKLLIKTLPDIPQFEIMQYMQEYIGKMVNMLEFEWQVGFPIQLDILSSNINITKLHGNIESTTTIPFSRVEEVVLTKSMDLPTANLTKLTLRNMNLMEFSINSTLRHLIIDNCNYEMDYLLNLKLNQLETFELLTESEDYKLVKFIATLINLKHLKITSSVLNLDYILPSIPKNLQTLQLNQFISFQTLKYLSCFKQVKFLQIQVLEKDLLELLPYLNQNLQFLSIEIIEPIHTSNNNNCLISKELWDSELTNINRLKFSDFILEFNRKLANLRWIEFKYDCKKYIFECDKTVIYREGFELYFERIVNTLI